jgi:D-tyrosyl-tRNA(Tyr) deacylase
VVQRVSSARVEVEGEVVGAIGRGLLVYLGFGKDDTPEDRKWLLAKVAGLRIFPDDAATGPAVGPHAAKGSGRSVNDKMSRSVMEAGASVLLVSQFTLYGDVQKGRRPSFDEAMDPERARSFYESAVEELASLGVPVQAGRFRAHMRVESVNDGPVTILLSTPKGS